MVQLAVALVCFAYVAPDFWKAVTRYDPLTPFALFLAGVIAIANAKHILNLVLSRRTPDGK